MTSLAKKMKSEVAVFGTIRNDMKELELNIPLEIINIVFLFFYVFDPFKLAYSITEKFDEFDKETMNTKMVIEGDNTIISRPGYGRSPYSFGTQILDSGVCIWRFRVLKMRLWRIGIIDSSQIYKNMSLCQHTIKPIYLIESSWREITNFCKSGSYLKNGTLYDKPLEADAHQDGFVICMMLNWNEQSLSFSFNNEAFITVTTEIDTNKRYRLAVCLAPACLLKLEASIIEM